MSVVATDSIPNFAEDPAVKLWARVPDDGKQLILSKVWCCRCRRGVTIVDYTGSIIGCDLLLSGQCSECQGDVARLVEMGLAEIDAYLVQTHAPYFSKLPTSATKRKSLLFLM